MGRGYIIEHVVSALTIKAKEDAWRNYIAEGFRVIAFNTSGSDTRMTMKPFHELTAPKEESVDADTKAKSIINNIKEKLKGG